MRAFGDAAAASSTAAGKRTLRSIKGQRGPQAVLKDPNNRDYKPSKPTALAFAIALELDLAETKDLLARAGYAPVPAANSTSLLSILSDRETTIFFAINEALFAFDQSLLGRDGCEDR